MKLIQLRYLVAVAENDLNITQAARVLHAAQPGVSKQLKQLEDELGFQLFERKGRALIRPTDAGNKRSRRPVLQAPRSRWTARRDPLSLVSPPESKYVRILASVLFQICQYALIGQVDPP